jgi:release factor glutamine methyltransferase
MSKFIKKIIHPFYKRYHFWLHKKPRKYSYKNIYTIVQPSVFSPINTISTKNFLNYISTIELTDNNILELGCGSGIIALYCASKGAKVTASDINKIALKSLKEVSRKQELFVETIHSDLFDNIQKKDFDFIFINPPYYPKNPKNIEEKAWFCGENFDFFEKLFLQLAKMITSSTMVLMILSDECDYHSIHSISKNNKLTLHKVHTKKLLFETNYIYQIRKNDNNLNSLTDEKIYYNISSSFVNCRSSHL